MCLDGPPEVLAIGLGQHDDELWHEYRFIGQWCMHIYRYNGVLLVGDERVPITPGSISLIPPDTLYRHMWPERPAVHACVHFRLAPGAATITVPLMQEAVESCDSLWDDLMEATTWLGAQDPRLSARVWDVLWRVASLEAPGTSARPPNVALDWAVRMIGTRLGDPIDIAKLAHDAGVSHNHLIRLFRTSFGQTVQAYIRTVRAQRAYHLLTQSTIPVKVVAKQVGIPDLQQFNKTIRRVYGLSPSQIRSQGAIDTEYRTKLPGR